MPLDNITELKKRVPGGKYALARAVAERARQLQGGATPLTEVRAPNPLSVAIDEIVQGKVTFRMHTEEQVAAEEKEASDAKDAAKLLAADASNDGGAASTPPADSSGMI